MPDGRSHVNGRQILYKNVTRKHSGQYVCAGSNGPGEDATDTVKVNVLREPNIFSLD